MIEVSKCTKCFTKTLKCRKCKLTGHYPSDCKATKTDMRNEDEMNEEEDEEVSQNDNRQSSTFTFKMTSKASQADDRQYGKSVRKMNNGLRCTHDVKDKNIVMASVPNLEWVGNSFVKKPPSP